MEPEVLGAMIAACASFVIAVGSLGASRWSQGRVTRLEAELAERAAVRNARIEYEFEARKRLYEECGPILFHLSELAERATDRISGLARRGAEGRLDAGWSWLDQNQYYRESTYYRLFAPLAAGLIFRRKLTHLNTSLDENIHWQYTLVKVLEDTFVNAFDIAGQDSWRVTLPRELWIDYDPNGTAKDQPREERTATTWPQGVARGRLENAAESLVVHDEKGRAAIMSFHSFQMALAEGGEPERTHQAFKVLDYLFDDFRPHHRPVLWRVLVTQFLIYRALETSMKPPERGEDPWAALAAEGWPRLDYRSAEQKAAVSEEEAQTPLRVAQHYVRARTAGFRTGAA
ncbi:MAG: hypothetical protein AAFU79_04050 [Myxococcota bacterium]